MNKIKIARIGSVIIPIWLHPVPRTYRIAGRRWMSVNFMRVNPSFKE